LQLSWVCTRLSNPKSRRWIYRSSTTCSTRLLPTTSTRTTAYSNRSRFPCPSSQPAASLRLGFTCIQNLRSEAPAGTPRWYHGVMRPNPVDRRYQVAQAASGRHGSCRMPQTAPTGRRALNDEPFWSGACLVRPVRTGFRGCVAVLRLSPRSTAPGRAFDHRWCLQGFPPALLSRRRRWRC